MYNHKTKFLLCPPFFSPRPFLFSANHFLLYDCEGIPQSSFAIDYAHWVDPTGTLSDKRQEVTHFAHCCRDLFIR